MHRPFVRLLILAVALIVAGSVLPPVLAAQQIPDAPIEIEVLPDGARVVAGEALVRFNATVSSAARDRGLANAQARVGRPLGQTGWSTVTFDRSLPVQAQVQVLRRLTAVAEVEPNYVRSIGWAPNDPIYNAGNVLNGAQWNFARINIEPAWDLSTGTGVKVAVLDTGILAPGASDRPVNVLTGYNALTGSSVVTDVHGHGSHVAGTIAQATNNGVGVAGIAFNAQIMPVKVCDDNGFCPSAALVAGLDWARTNGARVINLSLGGTGTSNAERNAVTNAINAGVVVVAAMGNEYLQGNPVSYPAAYPGVIAVGATTRDNVRSSYSNTGSHIFIAAPGGGSGWGIVQQAPRTCGAINPGFCSFNGTSMATPHVVGVVALMLARNPSLTVAQVKTYLQHTALDLGSSGFDNEFGYGLVQAGAAVAAVAPAPTPSPTPTPPPIATAAVAASSNPIQVGLAAPNKPTVPITFFGVTQPGTVQLTWVTGPPAEGPPAGFRSFLTHLRLDAGGTQFTSARLCAPYTAADLGTSFDAGALRLLHFENGAWRDVTDPVQFVVGTNTVCGTVTSFSPFILASYSSNLPALFRNRTGF